MTYRKKITILFFISSTLLLFCSVFITFPSLGICFFDICQNAWGVSVSRMVFPFLPPYILLCFLMFVGKEKMSNFFFNLLKFLVPLHILLITLTPHQECSFDFCLNTKYMVSVLSSVSISILFLLITCILWYKNRSYRS